MAKDTKQRILEEALSMFSQRGFEGTSMREIAGALGLGKSALYKHFPSKQAIFDGLVEEMLARHRAAGSTKGLAVGSVQEAARAYSSMTPDDMALLGETLLAHWTREPSAAAFRRMLSAERFRDGQAARAYDELFVSGPLRYHEALFSEMVVLGALRPGDPARMALEFWAPIHLLLQASDGDLGDKRALADVKEHVRAFAATYGRES